MNLSLKAACLLLVSIVLGGLPTRALGKTEIVIVLDCSASMGANKKIGRPNKMGPVKGALEEVVAEVESAGDKIDIGFWVYGSRFHSENLDGAAKDARQLVPLGDSGENAADVLAEIKKARPVGYTPLFYCLEKAAAAFDQGDEKILVVVTDGENFVKGVKSEDATRQAKTALKALKRNEVRVEIVGFNTGTKLLRGPSLAEFESMSDDVNYRLADSALKLRTELRKAIFAK